MGKHYLKKKKELWKESLDYVHQISVLNRLILSQPKHINLLQNKRSEFISTAFEIKKDKEGKICIKQNISFLTLFVLYNPILEKSMYLKTSLSDIIEIMQNILSLSRITVD